MIHCWKRPKNLLKLDLFNCRTLPRSYFIFSPFLWSQLKLNSLSLKNQDAQEPPPSTLAPPASEQPSAVAPSTGTSAPQESSSGPPPPSKWPQVCRLLAKTGEDHEAVQPDVLHQGPVHFGSNLAELYCDLPCIIDPLSIGCNDRK